MNLKGRRISTNVDDRRGKKTGVSLGIGGAIIVAIIAFMLGKDPSSALQNINLGGGTETTYTPTAEEEELATFAKQILAGTEDVWTAE